MTDVDIPALERIKGRLSASTAVELESILPSLIPKLIPLANHDSLRSKVVEILVEATRRSKLFSIKLSLNIFASCLSKAFLPFGCNLAFAFLDSVSDHGCLVDITPITIAKLLDALAGYDVFSYQSNAILYYLVTNNELIPEAISYMLEDKDFVLSILGDYYLDFLLYRAVPPTPMGPSTAQQTPATATTVKQIQHGLLDNRVHRIAFKHKQWAKLNLKAIKTSLVKTLQLSFPFDDAVRILIVLLGSMQEDDQDSIHASRFILNHIDHVTMSTTDSLNVHQTFWNERLFSRILTFLFPTTTAVLVNGETTTKSDSLYIQSRNAFKIEYVIHVLEYVNQKFDKFYYQTIEENSIPFEHLLQIWNEFLSLESATGTVSKSVYLTYHNSLLYPKLYSSFLELFVKVFRPDHLQATHSTTSNTASTANTNNAVSMQLSALKQRKRIAAWLSSSALLRLLDHIDATISHFAATANAIQASNQHHTSSSINHIMKFKAVVLEILDVLVMSKYTAPAPVISLQEATEHTMQEEEMTTTDTTVSSILLSSHMPLISKLFTLALYDNHCHTSTSPLFHILHQLQYTFLTCSTISSSAPAGKNTNSQSDFLMLMDTLLDACASSELSSCRMLYIPWSNGLFPFSQKMFVQLTLLADDSIDMVANTAIKQYDTMRNHIDFLCSKVSGNNSVFLVKKKLISIGKNIIQSLHNLLQTSSKGTERATKPLNTKKGIPHLLQLFDYVVTKYVVLAGRNADDVLSDHVNEANEMNAEIEAVYTQSLACTKYLLQHEYDYEKHPQGHVWNPAYYLTMSNQNINTYITEYAYYLYDGYASFLSDTSSSSSMMMMGGKTDASNPSTHILPKEIAQNNLYLIVMSALKLKSVVQQREGMMMVVERFPVGKFLYHKALRSGFVKLLFPTVEHEHQVHHIQVILQGLSQLQDRPRLLQMTPNEIFQLLIALQYVTHHSIQSSELIHAVVAFISTKLSLLLSSVVESIDHTNEEATNTSNKVEANYWIRMIVSDALDFLSTCLNQANIGGDASWADHLVTLQTVFLEQFVPLCSPPSTSSSAAAAATATAPAVTNPHDNFHWIGNKFLLHGFWKVFTQFVKAKIISVKDSMDTLFLAPEVLALVQDKSNTIKNDDRLLSVFSLAEQMISITSMTSMNAHDTIHTTDADTPLKNMIVNFEEFHLFERMENALFAQDMSSLSTSTTSSSEVKPSKLLLFYTVLAVLYIHTLYQAVETDTTTTTRFTLSFTTINRLLRLLLVSLKCKENALLQDLSVRGLSFLYYLCNPVSTTKSTRNEAATGKLEIEDQVEGLVKYTTVGQYIAEEIATTILRKKRSAPTTSSTETPTPPNGTTAGLNGILRDIPIPVGTGTGTGNGGANTAENDEVLQAATAMAMAEVQRAVGGNNPTAATNGATNTASAGDFEISETGYGAYTKVCQIFRKCGDGTVLLIALSLVKNDLSFGQTPCYSYLFDRVMYPLPDTIPLKKTQIISLIPMLYVSKFDPMTSVREIMSGVWDKLLSSAARMHPEDSRNSLENDLVASCQQAILQYIVNTGLLHPTWREREASCLALEALLLSSSMKWDTIQTVLDTLLIKGLKVIDDIRESTRMSAMKMMKLLLSHHILRACNAHETSAEIAASTVAQLLPILIHKGMVSASMEAKGFSLGTLLKLITEGDKVTLLPYLGQIIELLMESMSALEPQMLPYLSFHTISLQMSKEEWEEARLKLTSSSPMHDALTQCLQLLPMEMVSSICGIAQHQIVYGIGLPTRVTAANVFTYLAEKFPTTSSTSSSSSFGGNHLKQLQAFQALVKILCDAPYMESSLKKALIHAMGMTAKTIDASLLAEECELLIQRYNHTFFGTPMVLAGTTGTGTTSSSSSTVSSYYDTDIDFAMANCFLQILKKAGDRLVVSTGTATGTATGSATTTTEDLWTEILAISYIGSMDSETHPECAKAWSECFFTAIDVSGIGNKPSAILRCLPILLSKKIPVMLLQDSWLRRKLACVILLDVVNQYIRREDLLLTTPLTPLTPSTTTTVSSTTSIASSATSKPSKISSALGMSLYALFLTIPGVVWTGQYLVLDVWSAILHKIIGKEDGENTTMTWLSMDNTKRISGISLSRAAAEDVVFACTDESGTGTTGSISSSSSSRSSHFVRSLSLPLLTLGHPGTGTGMTKDITGTSATTATTVKSEESISMEHMTIDENEDDPMASSTPTTTPTSLPVSTPTSIPVTSTGGSPTIGYDQIKVEKDALSQWLVHAPSSSSSSSSVATWQWNLHAMLPMLFKELSRGEESYRISVANTIAQLPWAAMMNTCYQEDIPVLQQEPPAPQKSQEPPVVAVAPVGVGRNYYLHYYFHMFALVGLYTNMMEIEGKSIIAVSTTTATTSSSSSSSNSGNRSSTSGMPQEKRQKLSSAPALFGNRYGTLPSKPITSALKLRPPPPPVPVVTTPSNTPTTTPSTTGPTLVITSSLPPAIRRYLLQALSQGWTAELTLSPSTPSISTSTPSSSCAPPISTKALLLSLQVMIVHHPEVWSIRTSALEFVGILAARTSALTKEELGMVVCCMEKGILEPKFVQVKQAALQALDKVLRNGAHKTMIKEEFLSRIRKMLSTVSTDTQTSMLEMASKLQTLMLHY